MKKVHTAAEPTEAELVRGYLEANGIEAIVLGDALWGARGELPFTPDTLPTVWVLHDADFESACSLIRSRKGSAAVTHCPNCGYDLTGLPEARCPECGQPFSKPALWTCPTCGEQIEEQFTECWKCAGKHHRRA